MKRFKTLPFMLGTLGMLAGSPGISLAHESTQAPASPAAASQSVGGASSVEPSMDPVMRALLIGLAAKMLTEAAASPEPMETLGDSLERTLSSALRSPATLRMIEALMEQAFKDVPAELREPLALFASSMLNSVRREMLDSRRPRSVR